MPLVLLPFVPLITVLVGMTAVSVKCNEFECIDLVEDSLDCDVCWCYEEGGFGCFCCTMCHDTPRKCKHDHIIIHDDSSAAFHAYAKKS